MIDRLNYQKTYMMEWIKEKIMFSDLEQQSLDMAGNIADEWELSECKLALLQAFPESYINKRDELIVHKRSNTYLCLGDCKKPIDIECKVLEWFSRPASKGMPYSQEWRNRRFRKFMLDGINDFLETDFTESDMEEIYQYLGNAINHDKTVRFVESGYDFKVLEDV